MVSTGRAGVKLQLLEAGTSWRDGTERLAADVRTQEGGSPMLLYVADAPPGRGATLRLSAAMQREVVSRYIVEAAPEPEPAPRRRRRSGVPRPAANLQDGSYEVEEVIKERTRRGVRKAQVRYADTWETPSRLREFADLIEAQLQRWGQRTLVR